MLAELMAVSQRKTRLAERKTADETPEELRNAAFPDHAIGQERSVDVPLVSVVRERVAVAKESSTMVKESVEKAREMHRQHTDAILSQNALLQNMLLLG